MLVGSLFNIKLNVTGSFSAFNMFFKTRHFVLLKSLFGQTRLIPMSESIFLLLRGIDIFQGQNDRMHLMLGDIDSQRRLFIVIVR
jgi:hypothetical protein